MLIILNDELLRKAWNRSLHSPYAEIVIALFGGIVGAWVGLVVGWLLAQLFLAVLLLDLPFVIDPSFNGLAWAIYIAVATIWICASIGCWCSLSGQYEGAILTAILSAVTLGVVFYLVSIRSVAHSNALALLFLALAIPVGRVVYRLLFSLRRLWNSRASH